MDIDQIKREVTYKASSSSGPGGQHVNRVSSRVQLFFDVVNSSAFAKAEQEKALAYLQNKLTKDGVLILTSQKSRSQSSNKKLVFNELLSLLRTALIPTKSRRKTSIPTSVKRKRLKDKKRKSEKKKLRSYKPED